MILLIGLLLLLFAAVGSPKHVFGLGIVTQVMYIVPNGYDIATYMFLVLFIRTVIPYALLKQKVTLNDVQKIFLYFYVIAHISFIIFQGQFAKDLIITINRIAVVVFLFFHLFKDHKDLSILPRYMIIGAGLILLHIYTQFLGVNPFTNPYFDGTRLFPRGITDQRINPNEFSISLVWLLGFCLNYVFLYKSPERIRYKGLTIALIIILSGLSLPILGLLASRSSIVVFVLVILATLFKLNLKKAIVLLPFLLILYGVGSSSLRKDISIPFIGEHANQRFKDIDEATDSKNSWSRTALAKAGFQLFLGNPIFGIGLGNEKRGIRSITGDGKVSHNTYINLMSEFGLFGIFFMIGLAYVWKSGLWMETTFSIMLLLGLYGAVHIILYMTLTWIIIGFSYKMIEIQKYTIE